VDHYNDFWGFGSPACSNRLVMYRCSSLHSGDIPANYNYDLNPATGRFTIAAFLTGVKSTA